MQKKDSIWNSVRLNLCCVVDPWYQTFLIYNLCQTFVKTFPIVKSLLLVQIIASLILLNAHYNPHLRKYCPSTIAFVYVGSGQHPCPYNLKMLHIALFLLFILEPVLRASCLCFPFSSINYRIKFLLFYHVSAPSAFWVNPLNRRLFRLDQSSKSELFSSNCKSFRSISLISFSIRSFALISSKSFFVSSNQLFWKSLPVFKLSTCLSRHFKQKLVHWNESGYIVHELTEHWKWDSTKGRAAFYDQLFLSYGSFSRINCAVFSTK